MGNLPEVLLDVRANTLRRGIFILQFWVQRLKTLQFMHHLVKLLIAENWRFFYIVKPVCLMQLLAQIKDFFLLCHPKLV